MLRRCLLCLALAGAGCGIGHETWGQPLREAGRLLVLFHGYGAPATDLKALAIDLRDYGGLADTCFVLARGPESAGAGRAWFETGEQVGPLRERLLALIDKLGRKSGVPTAKIYLGGFSQGATVAVDLALHAPEPLAGVLAFSAAADPTGAWASAASRNPSTPFFIAQGTADSVVHPATAERLAALLQGGGHRVVRLSFAGGHQMTDEVRRAAGRFLAGKP